MSSFTMPDPNAIQPALQPAASGQPWADLEPVIMSAAQAAGRAAAEQMAGDRDVELLQSAGVGLKAIYAKHAADVATIKANKNLSDDGRRSDIADADAKRDAAVKHAAESGVGAIGDKILGRYAATPATALFPSAEIAPMASFLMQSANSILPSNLLQQAADTLREAVETKDGNARYRANQLLHSTFQPLLARFGQSPPLHWKYHAPQATELADLIDQHLDVARNLPAARAAKHLVESARNDFAWATRSANADGWDDFIIQTGAQSFTWPKKEQ